MANDSQTVVDRRAIINRAHEILAGIEHQRPVHGLQGSIRETAARWVDDELDSSLRRLGEILTSAHQQAAIQRQLNEDRDRLHHGDLSHDELTELGHHYEMLRHAACEYNHLVRGFIEGHREEVSRDELTQWLSMASQGRHDWAVGEVTGAISEIALHAALMGMPELRGLRYGTLEEDLHGTDFVAIWQGRALSIDAKTGRYYPLSERKHGQLHLEISVPREALRGFNLTRSGLDGLRRDVRRALHESGGVAAHGSHRPYQTIDN